MFIPICGNIPIIMYMLEYNVIERIITLNTLSYIWYIHIVPLP